MTLLSCSRLRSSCAPGGEADSSSDGIGARDTESGDSQAAPPPLPAAASDAPPASEATTEVRRACRA